MARIERQPAGWHAAGAEVSADDGVVMSCRFDVQLDLAWQTVDVQVSSWTDVRRAHRLTVDRQRRWRADGEPREDLSGCVDVDVSATPLTNTFPLRRLDALPAGESVTLPVAWVDVPSLEVHRVLQRYTRLSDPRPGRPATWEYADPIHGAFLLSVDDDGVVIDYQGFATRVTGH
jgi:hypothetical protein